MTMIEIRLPDELARRAGTAGLLSDASIQELLEDAMRRHARSPMLDVAERIHAADIPSMSMDEIDAEVKAYRAERRARQGNKGQERTPGSFADRS